MEIDAGGPCLLWFRAEPNLWETQAYFRCFGVAYRSVSAGSRIPAIIINFVVEDEWAADFYT